MRAQDPTTRLTRDSIFIMAILLLCFVYFHAGAGANEGSRLDLTRAIVDKHTTAIDDYATNTIDVANFDGHVYSDKAPGLSLAAVPAYAAVHALVSVPAAKLAALYGIDPNKVATAIENEALTVVLIMLPSALLGVALFRLLRLLALLRSVCIAAPLIAGLATSEFPFSLRFFGHQFTAVLLFLAFYLAFLMRQRLADERVMVPIGFLLGYAIISEYPAVLIAGAVAIYAICAARSKRWIGVAMLAGVPPLLLHATYNAATFGSFTALGYSHSASSVQQVGLLGVNGPTLEALWGITFSPYRGLFFLSPVLLLAIPGTISLWNGRRWRWEAALCAWAMLSFLVFNTSYLVWDGGWSVGPRHLVPMLPFAAIPMAAGLALANARRGMAAAVAALTVWSFIAVWLETIGGNDLPHEGVLNPLFDVSFPNLRVGKVLANLGMLVGLRQLISLVPLLAALAPLVGVLVRARVNPTPPRAVSPST